jgi:hypothetical protein
MCGVGKFQKLWRTSETDTCPHCGQTEDALHVWQCQSTPVADVRSDSLTTLRHALNKLDTHPDLIDLNLKYLDAWKNNTTLQQIDNKNRQYLLDLQDTIGACQFFEGWIHTEWEDITFNF